MWSKRGWKMDQRIKRLLCLYNKYWTSSARELQYTGNVISHECANYRVWFKSCVYPSTCKYQIDLLILAFTSSYELVKEIESLLFWKHWAPFSILKETVSTTRCLQHLKRDRAWLFLDYNIKERIGLKDGM